MTHLNSSNLGHFSAVLHCVENLPNPTDVLKPFTLPGRDGLVVDVIGGQGHLWVKVIARKAQALHLVWAGQGQFGQKTLLNQAKEFIDLANLNPVNFRAPKVCYAFYSGVTKPMSEALAGIGVVVLGEVLDVSLDVERKLSALNDLDLDSDSDFGDKSDLDSTGSLESDCELADLGCWSKTGLCKESVEKGNNLNSIRSAGASELQRQSGSLQVSSTKVEITTTAVEDFKPHISLPSESEKHCVSPVAETEKLCGSPVAETEKHCESPVLEAEKIFVSPVLEAEKHCESLLSEAEKSCGSPVAETEKLCGSPVLEAEKIFVSPVLEAEKHCESLLSEAEKSCGSPVAETEKLCGSPVLEAEKIFVSPVLEAEKHCESLLSEAEKSCGSPVAETEKLCGIPVLEAEKIFVSPVLEAEKHCESLLSEAEKRCGSPVAETEKLCGSPVLEAEKHCESPVSEAEKSFENPVLEAEKFCGSPVSEAEKHCEIPVLTDSHISVIPQSSCQQNYYFFDGMSMNDTFKSLFQHGDQEDVSCPLTVDTRPVMKVNLDVTAMIALISAITHGGCYFIFQDDVLSEQASEERHAPVLPKMKSFLQGKELFACQSAVAAFNTILHTLGGRSERARAAELMTRISVVPDCPSARTQKLPTSSKIKDRSKLIFGTGDELKMVTLTANSGFLRAAKNQGVEYTVFIHAARALTEAKEKTAQRLDRETGEVIT